jgi:hypothetical protein
VPNVTSLHADDPDRIGRYRLTGRISGMPGTGPVYLAMALDGTEVTIRVQRGNWTHDAAARDRFSAEASAARRVPPFCAARILDADVEDDYAYLVSQYVAGRSLLEVVSDDGRISGAELEALAIGSATGVASVHEAGLVHGSFGPEHVIMSAAGPRVIEYGITPPYGQATPAADMLAWAQTMVFAAIGRPPATLADLEALPGLLRESVADCLAGDPTTRPAARTVVLDLLDDAEPPAGALAEGSRRATLAAQSVPGSWEMQQAGAGRPGPGGRSHAADGPRQRRQDRSRTDDGYADDGYAEPRRAARERDGRDHGGRDRDGRNPDGRDHGGRDHGGPGRRRAGALPIAAAVVIIAVVAVVLVHVLQSAGQTHGSSRAASSTSPVSSTVSASPAPKITVPASFTGSWTGQARQVTPADTFDVRLALVARSTGGMVAYTSGSITCSGNLRLTASSDGTLTLDQRIVQGQRTCANGVVTLSTGTDGTVHFSFRGKTGPVATGTLTRLR